MDVSIKEHRLKEVNEHFKRLRFISTTFIGIAQVGDDDVCEIKGDPEMVVADITTLLVLVSKSTDDPKTFLSNYSKMVSVMAQHFDEDFGDPGEVIYESEDE